jgi:beta-phosphoglucomutase-like phosphatase (HAD superfamily)
VVIFDCNGVLIDSEAMASAVLADALKRVGVTLSADAVARGFHGWRLADVFATVESLMKRPLPADFPAAVVAETLKRLHAELRAVPHAAHVPTWIRGPKAVASSSTMHCIRTRLEINPLVAFL